MIIRIFFIAFLSIMPHVFYGQARLALKEISFVFESKDVTGTIADFQSTSEVNFEDISNSNFSGSVGVSSMKTGNFLRDWALKGRKYFDEDEHPKIQFRSTNIAESDDGIRVSGLLTIKGKSNPLEILFNRNGNNLIGKAELLTSDYDVYIKKKPEENKVLVTFDLLIEE